MSRFPLRLATTPLILATLAIASACDRDRYTGDSGSANGEVTYASYESLESALGGEVSSAQYRKWVAAKEALDRVKKLPPPVRASGVRPSEQEIDRAVQRLEQDARARQAIESAGMSVREYVLTTLALDRAMAASKGQRLVEPAAVAEAPAPPPVDTTAYPPASAPYPGAYPATPPAQAYPPGYQPAYPAAPAVPATPAEPEPQLPGTSRPSEPVYTPVPTPRRDSAVPPMPSDPARRAPAPATPPPASPPTPAPATPAPASPVPVTPVPATPTPTPVPPPATDPPSSSPQADTTATVSANSDFAP